MATQADVRRIALSLPGAREKPGHFAFEVVIKGKAKGFVWVWMERVDPKKARVPQPRVLAVRVATLVEKDRLIRENAETYFTEPHYEGFPAVLVRLPKIGLRELRSLMAAAWRTQASRDLLFVERQKKR